MLGESLELLIDNRGKNPPYAASGIPVVSGMSVRQDGLDLRDSKRASRDTWKQWMPNPTQRDDVIMTSEAPLGRVALVRTDEPMLIGQRVFGLRGRKGVLDCRFLYYALQSAPVQADLASRATGSTVLGIRQPELLKVKIPAPDFAQQQAIADVLGALDDKIATNEQALDSIDRLLAAKYESALKAGCREAALGEVAAFRNRQRIPLSSREREERRGTVPYYGAAGRLDFVDEPIFDESLVLVGEDGSVITNNGAPVLQYIWGPSWVNNHAHVLIGNGIATETLRCALKRSNVAHLVTGAVQPKISMGNLRNLTLQLPAQSAEFDEISTDFAAVTRAVTDESAVLARVRDELLPLLMSGKASVKDAEAAASEVL